MDYIPPIGGAADDPYVDANLAGGIEGSLVPAAAIEDTQREIVNVITGASMVPNAGDKTQLRQAITKMIQTAQHAVVVDQATFAPAVITGNAVYWDAANSRYDQAIADGTDKQDVHGVADVSNAKMYAFGAAPIFAGLTPGRYYLSTITPGAITSVAPVGSVVKVGDYISTTELFVDIDAQAGGFAARGVNADITALNAVVSGSVFRDNLVINGDMRIDQRNCGTAVALSTAWTYVVDRFAVQSTGVPSGTLTAQQVNPGVDGVSSALRIARVDGNYVNGVQVAYVARSVDCRRYAGKTVTISFKSRKGSTYAAGLFLVFSFGTGNDQSLSALNSGTWTGQQALVNQNLSSLLTANFTLMQVTINVPATATQLGFQVSTGNFAGAGSANDWIEVTDFQIEKSAAATEFKSLPEGAARALCEGYYEKSYSLSVKPGTPESYGCTTFIFSQVTTVNEIFAQTSFRTSKRSSPSVTLYGVMTGAAGKVTKIYTAGSDVTGGILSIGQGGFSAGCGPNTGTGQGVQYHWAADAEFY
jgi:hypothetical protein